MHNLERIIKANEDQIRREYDDAVKTEQWSLALKIARANPDLFYRAAR